MLNLAKCVVLMAVTLTISSLSLAQISVGGAPPSVTQRLSGTVSTVTMPPRDNATLIAQADAQEANAIASNTEIPYQVADVIDVNLNLNNSGSWETLADGTRIWRLRIVSPNALATHIIYNRLWFPKYCELFLYNDDKTEILGAFTVANNLDSDSTNVTGLIYGEAVTLEYVVKPQAQSIGELSIWKVLHHFRAPSLFEPSPVDTFGQAQGCNVNVNCPSGVPWASQRNAVMLMFMPGGGSCSGALINNTRNDGNPLILSAYHCYPTGSQSGFLFQFKFQSPACPNAVSAETLYVGTAYVESRWIDSDFLLLYMANPPPMTCSPYFAGWDRTGNTPGGCVSIHHPRADIKKISMKNSALFSTDWNGNYPNTHWGMNAWDSGITEGGSSGSPWYNPSGLIIGQLHGGLTSCAGGGPDKAGKFSSSWNGGGDSGNRLSDYLDPGVGNSGTLGGFQPVAPSNDTRCTATTISSLPYYTNGNTRFATAEIVNCQDVSAPDVWWKLTVPCSTYVTVTTCGSYYDTELYVYRGTCTGYFAEIGCNDDDPNLYCQINNSPGASRLQFWAWADPEEYYIQLSGYGGQSGVYYLNVTGTSTLSNDVCPGYPITDLPYVNTGNTTCAVNQYVASCGNENGSPDVYFRLISPCSGWIDLTTCGSTFDTQLEISRIPYPGVCGTGSTLIGCNDDGGDCLFNQYASFIHTYVYANDINDILLQGYNGASGYYRLSITPVNPGENCSNPINIASLPYTNLGDTRCAASDFDGCVDVGSPDKIYTYTPSTCHVARVSLCGSGFDTSVRVQTGGACPGSTQIACNDDYCGLQSQLDFNALAGVTYYIIVAGYNTNEGPYTMTVSNVGGYVDPFNGCTGQNFSSLPYTASGSTRCATFDYNVHCGGGTANDVIYTFTLPLCYNVTASLCGSDYDTRLDIRTDPPCPGSTLVDCNDDSYCGGIYTYQSNVTWLAQANVGYRILIHGFGAANGAYVLNVTGTLCNIVPAPVVDVVTTFDIVTGNVTLTWTPVNYADIYHIYRSSNFATLFDPANEIATASGGTYTCVGCINDPDVISFFGAIADNQPAIMAPPADSPLDGLTKEQAVQGEVNIAWDKMPAVYNEEHAEPNKSKIIVADK